MKKINLKTICIVTSLSFILTGCQSEIKPENKVESETKPSIEYNIDNKEEFTYFEDAKQSLKEYVESEEYETFKKKSKEYIITGIDFIFYDQPINNVYFKDLKTDAKKGVMDSLKSIDETLMMYYPEYKEDISDKYNVAMMFLDKKYIATLDKIKEYLGEEKYNEIGNKKDEVLNDIGENLEQAESYIKKKYEEWKNK